MYDNTTSCFHFRTQATKPELVLDDGGCRDTPLRQQTAHALISGHRNQSSPTIKTSRAYQTLSDVLSMYYVIYEHRTYFQKNWSTPLGAWNILGKFRIGVSKYGLFISPQPMMHETLMLLLFVTLLFMNNLRTYIWLHVPIIRTLCAWELIQVLWHGIVYIIMDCI